MGPIDGEPERTSASRKQPNGDVRDLLGTDVGTLLLDRDLRIRAYTARMGSFLRLGPQDVGRELRHFSHRIERPTLVEDVRRALRDGATVEDETFDRNGRPYLLRILPCRVGDAPDDASPAGEGGDGLVLTLTDVSALSQARSRLATISAIVESSDDAIIGKDLDGIVTSWNPGAERLYGYAAEEMVGQGIERLVPPGKEPELDEFMVRLRAGEHVEAVETRRVRKDGAVLDVSVKVSPIRDGAGRVIGASAIARDIGPTLRARREAAERREQIEALLESAAEAILGVDADGRCTFANPACARMIGYESLESIVGASLHEIMHTSPFGPAPHVAESCSLLGAVRGGASVHRESETIWRRDGSTFLAEVWCHPVNREQRSNGAVVTFLDITQRVRSEQAIRDAARRREQFLAMLSHELRNPLAAVLTATALVRADGPSPEALDRATRVIDRQCQHMARLLDDLLDVSRITQGKIQLRRRRIDARDPVESALEAMAPRLEERGVHVELSLTGDELPLHADPHRLQQVVTNLMSNAARHSPDGGRIELSLRREDDRAVIVIRDHGDGIPPEMLPRIFDLFVQSDQALDRSHGGLGVGLTLVRSIVELHGGTVDVKSDGPGQGSEFSVRIPTGSVSAGAPPPPDGEDERVARRVLIVEDQRDAREMLRSLLEMNGHRVVEAADGQAGIDAIRRERPEIAIVDIGLPTISGYEVARTVRADRSLDDVFLVALTGYGTDSDVAEAKRAGFDEHVTKPTDPDELERLVRSRRRGWVAR